MNIIENKNENWSFRQLHPPPPGYTDYVFEEFREKLVVKISDKVAPLPFKKRCLVPDVKVMLSLV